MTLIHKLVAVIAITAYSTMAYPQNYHQLPSRAAGQTAEGVGLYNSRLLEPFYDTLALPSSDLPIAAAVPATNLQLPKLEQTSVPFYSSSEESNENPLPQQPQTYYSNNDGIAVPDQELRAPIETEWNPNNDPKYYYEVPAIITKQELPTNIYPKKFNKDIHIKAKPYSNKPKQEILLNPIDEKQYEYKQKTLNKAFNNLAKKENQKLLQQVNNNNNNPKELLNSASDIHVQSSSKGINDDNENSESYSQGLSADITASLGITSPHSTNNGERLEFHITGHDGPKSYKWGYDTGKGHNRQFRYEERDKTGVVKGHFGYYDKHGKLQLFHYDAQPDHGGFHISEGN